MREGVPEGRTSRLLGRSEAREAVAEALGVLVSSVLLESECRGRDQTWDGIGEEQGRTYAFWLTVIMKVCLQVWQMIPALSLACSPPPKSHNPTDQRISLRLL